MDRDINNIINVSLALEDIKQKNMQRMLKGSSTIAHEQYFLQKSVVMLKSNGKVIWRILSIYLCEERQDSLLNTKIQL